MIRVSNYNINNTKMNFSGDISTYMDSYREHKNIRTNRPRPQRENTDKPVPNPPPRMILDLQTYTPLRHQIPISLMVVPNEVTRGNPLDPTEHIEIPEDDEKEKVMRTRPRLYKSPQVSLDDVLDPDMRKIILDYTYTPVSKKTNLDLWNLIEIEYREVPETVVDHDKYSANEHHSRVYFQPKSLLQFEMTEEQNRRGRYWEKDRIVGVANSTEHFWKENSSKYRSSQNEVLNLVEKDTIDEIGRLVENDKLDVQHDKTSPGYAGYKSNVAVGVNLRKKIIPQNHPLLSTYQEAFSRKIHRNNFKTIS